METAGLVLAAGAGSRYGMPKALVPYAGMLLVERAAETLRSAGISLSVVVLGASAPEALPLTGGFSEAVINTEWATGMGSSLRAGLRALTGTPAIATVVLLVDMPEVTPAAVRRVSARAAADALVMGGYAGRRGHPVLLGRDHWDGVIDSAVGDKGARDYLRAHAADVRIVEVGDVAGDLDLDEPPHA
ncbi:nucleotidyltransferase family protein [Actinoplanes sp. NPDC026619]|uniref:nucleotidyltransferase family protein n=1 Tax=Actinoplanes sp. NPDC026619 TaxID=3155798 RepID=UPI0033C7842F